jgi:predicted membrane protein
MLQKTIISMVLLAVMVAILTTGLISAVFTLLAFSLLFYYVTNTNKNVEKTTRREHH